MERKRTLGFLASSKCLNNSSSIKSAKRFKDNGLTSVSRYAATFNPVFEQCCFDEAHPTTKIAINRVLSGIEATIIH
jgi:hypothetical protein